MSIFSIAERSLPSRERGLKSDQQAALVRQWESLPSRERGLKFYGGGGNGKGILVAPFTGAWIEMWMMAM